MSERIFGFFRLFDIFGLVPLMTFARAPKVYSRLSMALSLTTLAFLLFMTLYLGLSVVNRKNPSFFQYRLPNTDSKDRLDFSADTFPIKLSKTIGDLVYGTDFFLNAYVQTYNPSYTSYQFNTITCPDNPSYACFTQTTNVGKTSFSTSGGDLFSIDLSVCANPGFGCATSSHIDSQLSISNFFFLYTDKVVDPYDYDNPIKDRPMQNSEHFQADSNKRVVIYLEHLEFTSDDGWIFENLKTFTTVSLKSIQTYPGDVTNQFRGSLLLLFTGDKNVYRRTYPKLQDLLAQMSGIVGFLLPILAILAFPYAEMKMREYMVNELYEVKLNRKEGGGPSNEAKMKLLAAKLPLKKILPDSTGVTRQNTEDSSPQKRLMKGKLSEDIGFGDSFENSRASGIDTPVSRPSTFGSTQTKYNTLKKSSLNQAKQEGETPAAKDEDGLLGKVAAGEKEGKPENEAIEVRGEKVLLNEARHSERLNVTFGQFLKSYFKTQPEIEVLKKVEQELTDTMDLATLAKKSSDLDKLKAILFSAEERAIFDNLPVSVLSVGVEKQENSDKEKVVVNHYKWENSLRGNVEKVNEAYVTLKELEEKTELQRKLLGLYESQYIGDDTPE